MSFNPRIRTISRNSLAVAVSAWIWSRCRISISSSFRTAGFSSFSREFSSDFVAFKALAVVHAEYFDLRQAFENAHQRVYFADRFASDITEILLGLILKRPPHLKRSLENIPLCPRFREAVGCFDCSVVFVLQDYLLDSVSSYSESSV